MNKTYRVVFNEAIGAWIAVPEIARVRGKVGRVRKALLGTLLAAGFAASGGVVADEALEPEPVDSRRGASVGSGAAPEVAASSVADTGSASADKGASCEPRADELGQPIAGSCDGTSAEALPMPRDLWLAGLVAAGAGLVAVGMSGGDDGVSPTPGPQPDPQPDPMPGPDLGTVTYANGVTVDKASRTLTIQGVSYAYEPYGNGYRLTPLSGGDVTYVDRWTVNTDANTVTIRGQSGDGLFWIFDGAGLFTRATAATTVVKGDGARVHVDAPAAADVRNTAAVIVDGNSTTTEIKAGTTATNGGTGAAIYGDHAAVHIDGRTEASGQGSTGTRVSGNDAAVSMAASAAVRDGGVAMDIRGDRARIDISSTDVHVNDAGSALLRVTGNDAVIALDGTLHVNGGAHGVDVRGDRATLNTSATIHVADMNSVGIDITAGNAGFGDFTRVENTGDINVSLNGTGARIAGGGAAVLIDGNVNVVAARNESGVLQRGDGVLVGGDHNTVRIDGKVSVGNETLGDEEVSASGGMIRGVSVSGQENAVHVTGGIELTSSANIRRNTGSSLIGLEVDNDFNTVQVDGGIKLGLHDPDTGHDLIGILASGDSTVSIRGLSTVDNSGGSLGETQLARAANGARIGLESDSVLKVAIGNEPFAQAQLHGTLQASGEGSLVANAGLIDASDSTILGVLMRAFDHGAVDNAGTIRAQVEGAQEGTFQMANGPGSRAVNRGNLTLSASGTPFSQDGVNIYPLRWDSAAYAQLAEGGAVAVNTADGVIDLHGPGLFGTSASADGTAINQGTIQLDGFIPITDASGSLAGSIAYTTNTSRYRGGGMVAGSTDAGFGNNAQATNTGVINIRNSGFGMLALNGGTVTNAGTINLGADSTTVSDGTPHQLVGMGALYGGIAINAENGVINIATDLGRAFYADADSRIVNRGRINVGPGIDPAVDNSSSVAQTEYNDGSQLSGVGETLTLPGPAGTTLNAGSSVSVTNAGVVDGGSFAVNALGKLTNLASGELRTDVTVWSDGALENLGTMNAAVFLKGNGTFTNANMFDGKIVARGWGNRIANSGSMSSAADAAISLSDDAVLSNAGVVSSDVRAGWRSQFLNESGGVVNLAGEQDILQTEASTVLNRGIINASGASANVSAAMRAMAGGISATGSPGQVINEGTINASGGYGAMATITTAASVRSSLVNKGIIDFEAGGTASQNKAAIRLRNGNYDAYNEAGGVIHVRGDNGIGMLIGEGGTGEAVNRGTINLGVAGQPASHGTGLVGMMLDAPAATAVIRNDTTGVININANDSYAFAITGRAKGQGRIVNLGRVTIGEGVTGSGLIAPGDEGYVSNVDTANTVQDPAPLRSAVRRYTVGTSANGTAGTMRVNYADLVDVNVDTGFAAGTGSRVVSFDGVFQGQDIAGAENIRSASPVWTASGSKDSAGNVNVTMTKNAYQDIVTDVALKQAAAALEAGYAGNTMFGSLNLGSVNEVTNGIRQLTGQGFGTAMNQARVLSHRFGVLADSVREGPGGIGFNLVTRGSPGSRLAGSEYDMAVLASRFDMGGAGKLALRYGVANLLNLDRNSRATTRHGLSGVSQFAGMQYSKPLGAGFELTGDLQFEQHRLESTRALNYGSVRETATSRNGQDKTLVNLQAGKPMAMSRGFSFTPSLGMEMRRTRDHAVAEHGAGLYNLDVTGASTTAVDAVAGMKLGFANDRGLTASLSVHGGPNLGYAGGHRYASLAGAPDARFRLPESSGRARFNYKGRFNVGYATALSTVSLDGYMAEQDRTRDYGVMLNVSRYF
ncbi:hypothetical protein LMG23992_01986 [Cupriavidus laharis]|uniref:Autotransporter domain-containing protein n=1 Tax=Cupriavidus laharis TaxID=151654 RepID=A0ABN7YHN7_9BURK|nr:ESPR-type extended signal peptide-containing protein [Cupriavidus laharis]CAG9171595.1 hypothetical protein LMG23992_01986 [Cupriavidus laharis]